VPWGGTQAGTVRGLMGVQGGPDVKDVLVVDDEHSLRLLCRVNLELDGHHVREAGTLAEARRELERATPDVILLDVHVGADDGLELLDEIADLELDTRVVLLSGTSEIGPDLRARVDSVLGKPFDLKRLAAAVAGSLVR
jgi:DNA-binding NtrC family response regulator